MPRLRQVRRSEADQQRVLPLYNFLFGDRDPVDEPGTSTGTTGDWWTVFALSPDIFDHSVKGFGLYRSPERRLDGQLRELGQTRAGWLAGSQFVYSQHCKSCRGLGMPEEKISAIHAWEVAECFDAKERALLAYTDYLVDQHGRVPDAVFDAMKTHFSDEEILEFTYITSLYFMHAVMTRALRLEFDDRDEAIVEVVAPEDFDAQQFAGRRRGDD
jgi:alkylhydroperoxidase family enzyme